MYFLNTKVNPDLSLTVHRIFATDLERLFPKAMKLLRQYADDKKIIACQRIRHDLVYDVELLREIGSKWFAYSVGQDIHDIYLTAKSHGCDILEITDDTFI